MNSKQEQLRLFWSKKSKDTDFIIDWRINSTWNLIRYDENFNNKRKVAFESCLAKVIRYHPGVLFSSVSRVAKSILPDIIETFNKLCIQNEANAFEGLYYHFFNCFFQNQDIFAEYQGQFQEIVPALSKNLEDIAAFFDWIGTILSSDQEKAFYQQLLLIREYGSYFLRPYVHMPEFAAENEGLGMLIVPEGIGFESQKPAMRALWKRCNFDFRTVEEIHSRVSTRDTRRNCISPDFGIFANAMDMKQSGEDFPAIKPHLPGKNLWRVTQTSSFTKEARFKLDMPLIASQGCSIALLLIPGMTIARLNKEELMYYNLSALSYMIGQGHHSFHEFSAVWKAFDIPYKQGDYASIFPQEILTSHPEISRIFKEFSDILPEIREKGLG